MVQRHTDFEVPFAVPGLKDSHSKENKPGVNEVYWIRESR
jgi:hypothetical protein